MFLRQDFYTIHICSAKLFFTKISLFYMNLRHLKKIFMTGIILFPVFLVIFLSNVFLKWKKISFFLF